MFRYLILVLTGLNFYVGSAQTNDSLFIKLEEAISARDFYLNKKIGRINDYYKQLHQAETSRQFAKIYDLKHKLFNEYESFIYDSAFKYAMEVKQIAELENDIQKVANAKLNLGFVLLSSGLFKEAIDTLKSIKYYNSDSFKAELNATIGRSYYDLADYSSDRYFSNIYKKIGNTYLEEACRLSNENSYKYWSYEALRRMKSNDYPGAIEAFQYQLAHFNLQDHELAIAASSLGYIYNLIGNKEKSTEFLIKAAIADIKSSTKETVALRNISDLIFKKGDVKTAYRYIKLALDDATFYNARHRKIEIATILPIIEGEKLNTVEKQKSLLIAYSALLSFLSFAVIVFLIIIFRQLKRIKHAKQLIQETNQSLTESNHKLTEANKIKETYIGYFFNTNSDYIGKIEKLQRDINRKLTTHQIEDVKNIVKNIDLKKEREELFYNFDKTFLKLFPGFVEEFNKLFKEEDRIDLKDKELLNTDLRIFALIRMGIDDNEKIAKILEYSVNTIYTYKTKIKNKSIVPNDEFERYIMAIKAV